MGGFGKIGRLIIRSIAPFIAFYLLFSICFSVFMIYKPNSITYDLLRISNLILLALSLIATYIYVKKDNRKKLCEGDNSRAITALEYDISELDEKFAKISVEDKKRYDAHRLIRRWVGLFAALYILFMMCGGMLAGSTSSNQDNIETIINMISLPLSLIVTYFWLKKDNQKRYSKLFINDQDSSIVIFLFENLALLVIVFFIPLLIIFGKIMPKIDIQGIATSFAMVGIPICIVVLSICYNKNTSSYTPKS